MDAQIRYFFVLGKKIRHHFDIPRKIQHTPGAHPNTSPFANYERNPDLWPVGKGFGLGVCSSSVCCFTTLEWYGYFLQWWVSPISTPKWSRLVGKPHGLGGETHHFLGNTHVNIPIILPGFLIDVRWLVCVYASTLDLFSWIMYMDSSFFGKKHPTDKKVAPVASPLHWDQHVQLRGECSKHSW